MGLCDEWRTVPRVRILSSDDRRPGYTPVPEGDTDELPEDRLMDGSEAMTTAEIEARLDEANKCVRTIELRADFCNISSNHLVNMRFQGILTECIDAIRGRMRLYESLLHEKQRMG
jgi:hypothetical protein